jgi:hypothetical protein
MRSAVAVIAAQYGLAAIAVVLVAVGGFLAISWDQMRSHGRGFEAHFGNRLFSIRFKIMAEDVASQETPNRSERNLRETLDEAPTVRARELANDVETGV